MFILHGVFTNPIITYIHFSCHIILHIHEGLMRD
jgi:hypothetical protein